MFVHRLHFLCLYFTHIWAVWFRFSIWLLSAPSENLTGFQSVFWGLGILCSIQNVLWFEGPDRLRGKLSWGSILWFLSFFLTSRISSNARILSPDTENSPVPAESHPQPLGGPLLPQGQFSRIGPFVHISYIACFPPATVSTAPQSEESSHLVFFW